MEGTPNENLFVRIHYFDLFWQHPIDGKPLIAVDKRTDAPDFALQDLNGETKKLSDYKGKSRGDQSLGDLV